MKKAILISLPAIYLTACTEPAPPPPPPPSKPVHHHVKAKSDDPENFRAVEKPPTYR